MKKWQFSKRNFQKQRTWKFRKKKDHENFWKKKNMKILKKKEYENLDIKRENFQKKTWKKKKMKILKKTWQFLK